MRKIFKANSESTCEKRYLEEWDNKPDDWHWTTALALAAYKPPARRGRPPKAETAEAVEEPATEE